MGRFKHSIATALVAAVWAVAAAGPTPAFAQAGRTTLIELTPHLAVNDAAERIEAMDYAVAIDILDTFLANEPMPPPEAYYLLGVAHYQLKDYA
jgi:hypothetical protein